LLVLSRKEGERILIGDNVEVVVQKIGGGRVSLGIKAPKRVHVVRKELVDNETGREDGQDGD
jgi:carbon storage regulator